tara:strand:+ start:800 stop:1006 length:207 start_codon:yes stop_codon:yes gene_type:complete
MDYSIIYLMHVLFGGPLLIYGGYAGKILSEKHKDEQYINVFMMLMFVGALLVLYHGYKFLKMKGFLKK